MKKSNSPQGSTVEARGVVGAHRWHGAACLRYGTAVAFIAPFALQACAATESGGPGSPATAGASGQSAGGSVSGGSSGTSPGGSASSGAAGATRGGAGGSTAGAGGTAGGAGAGGNDGTGTKGDPYNFAPSSRTVIPIAVLSSSGTVSNPKNVLTGKPTTLAGKGAQVVLDFGKEVGGILSLELVAASGAQSVGVAFSESSLYVGPNSDNSAGGGQPDGALSVAVTGATAWTSEAKFLRGGFRYVTIFMQSTGAVDLSRVSLAFSPDPERKIPNDYPNFFYSNDEVLNKAWYAGAYTFQTNVILNHQGRVPPAPATNWDSTAAVGESGTTVVVDGAKRDRTVWPGDLGISVPTGYAALAETQAAKSSIVTLFNHQHADGHLNWSGPPWNLDPGSDTYHLWTLHGTYLTYLYSGDKTWLDSVWPKYKTALTYIIGKIDPSGLLNVTGTADWGPRVGQGGQNIEANSLLYAVLGGAATLSTVEGDAASASKYSALATTLKTAVNATLWDKSVGAFKDNPTSALHPQDGNSLAVWFDVIDDPLKAKGLSYVHLSNWNAIGSITPEWGQISTFIGSMELMSHFVAGYDKRALDMIRKMWGYMLSAPTGTQSTFWESFTTDGTFDSNGNGPAPSASFTSLAHGWGTGPTSALTFYVLGVAPDSAAGQKFHVIPHPGDLTHAEGKLTFAPGKAVRLAYDVGASCQTFSLNVDSSSNTGSLGTIAVPRFGATHSVKIDGNTAWDGAGFVATPGVESAKQDEAYIYFSGVQPGTHTFAYADGKGCPSAPEEWSFCAAENGSCVVVGTKRIRFGRDGKFTYKIAAAGSQPCTSAALGPDPIPNTPKLCQVSTELYTACAAEGGTCSFAGSKEVRYGANGQWKTLPTTNSVVCGSAAFGGDPLPQVVKTCEYR